MNIVAGAFLIVVGLCLWLAASKPTHGVGRYALPGIAPMITPQVERILSKGRRPAAAIVMAVGVLVLIDGIISALS